MTIKWFNLIKNTGMEIIPDFPQKLEQKCFLEKFSKFFPANPGNSMKKIHPKTDSKGCKHLYTRR